MRYPIDNNLYLYPIKQRNLMKEQLKMTETVILIDAAFLNFMTSSVKNNFELMLKRDLQEVDLSHLITYIALDAHIPKGKGETQVFLIYDDDSTCLFHTHPSNLVKELNNVAFTNDLGEFSFYTFQPEKMASRQDLFLESLKVIKESKEVTKLIVLSFNEEYGNEVNNILKTIGDKKVIQFRMNEPEQKVMYRWEMLAYPVMQALGIRGDELD